MHLGEAQIPDGLRVYAIGDVHGCDDLLAGVHGGIDRDLTARPVADHRVIHLGDYVDRGPASATVVERLSRLQAADERVLCLRGNHEEMLLEFLADPIEGAANFLGNSGETTLASYGTILDRGMVSPRDLINLAHDFAMRMPAQHRKFLATLPTSFRFGDYFFCHAGIRPGVALDQQDPSDLIWIREEFLASDADFGVVVVHGHTPSREPEIRANRINIDTGAVLWGRLTCLVLEGNSWRFL
jgi:diadenosine tetraphosphatase ApaH/serine/threonine PP2A family protein phosphatase